ncbi:hypothetical protein ACKLNR_010567 [Fusarium oxysporum f. sp. zingiberi]
MQACVFFINNIRIEAFNRRFTSADSDNISTRTNARRTLFFFHSFATPSHSTSTFFSLVLECILKTSF